MSAFTRPITFFHDFVDLIAQDFFAVILTAQKICSHYLMQKFVKNLGDID